MVQVSYPGVYIREVPSGSRTITGVSTSIAAFVGAAKRGPVDDPVAILSYSDYARVFSEDTVDSEMTDQVRQFFLNGGQQAYVLRIANGALNASVPLPGSELTLVARNKGADGNDLRVIVDYATAEPERTFNLTIYREAISSTGVVEIVEQEQFKALTMDRSSPRNAKLVIDRDSKFCTAEVTGSVTSTAGVSIAGRLLPSANYGTAAQALLTPRLGTNAGRFRITVGSHSGVASVLPEVFGDAADLQQAIADTSGIPADRFTVEYVAATATAPNVAYSTLVIRATNAADDVRLESVPDTAVDIAGTLGLGAAQGGLEFGNYSDARPTPNGIVSRLASNSAGVTALLTLAGTARTAFSGNLTLTGPVATFTTALTAPTGGSFAQATASGPATLTNLSAIFERLANAINDNTTNHSFKASVQGLRLAVNATYGAASAGADHAFSAGPSWLVGASGILPAAADAVLPRASALGGGTSGAFPEATDYRTAFNTLESKVDLVNLLILPRTNGEGNDHRGDVWGDASAFCDRNRAFLLIDATPVPTTIDSALAAVKNNRVGIVKDHSAMYWPRIIVRPDGQRRAIDPSGTIAGVMSRIDSTRGVWKAPAGTEADLRGVFGVEVPMSDPENGRLNPEALNCIRAFTNGIISWGARTMDGFDNSGNDDYKYVPVRRFALFLEESLYRGLQWAVFEPNDQRLWSQIRMVVSSFMNGLFRQGAFFGETAKEAFFVKVDAETTTPNDINLGICNVVVGFAPVKPAEFIVVTIKQKAGQVQV
jgi:phage tail sheath protein FI